MLLPPLSLARLPAAVKLPLAAMQAAQPPERLLALRGAATVAYCAAAQALVPSRLPVYLKLALGRHATAPRP